MRERIYKFDNIKFLLILLVVIGHCVELYIDKYDSMKKVYIFIYSFHMPLFIFISGFFQKRVYHFKDLPLKKICYYFYLIIVIFVLIILSNDLFSISIPSSFLSTHEVHWFLFAMIFYSLMVPIISHLNLNILFIISCFLGCFIGFDSGIGDFLSLSRIIVFFPFFCLGFIFSDKKDTLINLTNNIVLKFFSICIIIFFLYLCYKKIDLVWQYKMLFTGKNSFDIIDSIHNCSYRHRYVAYMVSLAMGFSIMCIIPNRRISIITKLGKRTIQVYVFHKALIYLLNNIGLFSTLDKLFKEKNVFVMLLIGLIITLFLSIKFINNIMNRFYDMIFYKKEVQYNEE